MTVYLDTNILIYLLEGHAEYSERIADTLDTFRAEGCAFATSVMTLTEFLAGSSAADVRPLQQLPRLTVVPVDEAIALRAGMLQHESTLRIGDAVHVATAEAVQAEVFYSNDRELLKKLPGTLRPKGVL